jgi:hypothetical protein
LSPAAETFQRNITEFCQRHNSSLTRLLREKDPRKAERELEQISRQAWQSGEPLQFSIFLLDNQENIVSGYLSPNSMPEQISLESYRQGRFRLPKAIKRALTKGRVEKVRLYIQGGGEVWIVAVPLGDDGVTGAALLSFHGNMLAEKRGLTPDDFMAIDFCR